MEGAGIATAIGRGIGVATQLWLLAKGGKHIKAKLSQLKFEAKIMLNIFRTSL